MPATSFFGGEFFGGEFFNAAGAAVAEVTRPRPDDGGGIRKRRTIFKPTGLVERKTLSIPEGRKSVDQRVADSIEIEAEAAGAVARKLRGRIEQAETVKPIARMSLAEVEREIGVLLHKKLRTEEDEMWLLMLMAVTAAVA